MSIYSIYIPSPIIECWSTLYLILWHIYYYNYGRSETDNNSILLKVVLAAQALAVTVTTLGLLNTQSNISMAKSSE